MSSVSDPTQAVLAAKQAAIGNEITYAVLAKTNDAAKQQGEAAVSLVEQAAQLSKAIGAGGKFDGQA